MVASWLKNSALAIVAGAMVAGGTGVAQAGSITAGGWQMSWPSAFDDSSGTFVTLTLLAQTNDAIVLQKVGAFTDGPDQYGLIAPLEINFQQMTQDAVKQIVITSEQITNASGSDWSAFKFIIEDGTTGDPTRDVHYNLNESFYDGNPFDATPFTSWSSSGVAGLPQTLVFSGGTLTNGSIWTPGIGTGNGNGGEIVINANPSQTGQQRFVFKEQPIPTAIPLPAAAWMGLSSMVFLAIPRATRKVRELIA